ncbi:MAG: hypothetical protein QCH31_11975 [Methanolobus sp.]|nr:hypothetical protein [Methanolobus sp.]
MVHTCDIVTRTQSSQDEYGSPVYTGSSLSTKCRFFHNSSNGGIISQDSGKHVISTPTVLLPPDVAVKEGQIITSNVPGFEMDYEVTAVKPVFSLFSNTLHHYECDIKAVDH